MEHLIANSGIHFISREVEFNPSEPIVLSNGSALKYSFSESIDFLEGKKVFSLLYYDKEDGKYIPINELIEATDANVLKRKPNGREIVDESGMIIMSDGYNTTLFTTYEEDDADVFSINSPLSFRVNDPQNSYSKVPAFDLLLNRWLPMPMFQKEIDGITSNFPMGWCRMKIQEIGQGKKKGEYKYRLIWAFDTQMADDELSMLRPYIPEEESNVAEYCMCNKTDLLMDFMSSSDEFHAFSDYIASLLGVDLTTEDVSSIYKAYYIYFINYIRLIGGAPEIALHNNRSKEVFVDLVLDIGNSRTCGVLFEEGDFTKGKMLELCDLSNPWIRYENKTYDMRVVFRKADFGNDIVLDEEMFQWKSFVRIGEEAQRLVYRSLEEEGLSEKTTNYSSPKRYLWDEKAYLGQWENLTTKDDPYNVKLTNEIFVPQLSDCFDKEGNFSEGGFEITDKFELLDFDQKEHRYSRSSLMTFAFIELFQHAITQINSIRYREQWGKVDLRRYIRNIIITCPTAMPLKEQVKLRKCAEDAYNALTKCLPGLSTASIIPSPEALKITDEYADPQKRVWNYDEASCCQLVYLYAEIAQRYSGEIHKFFDLKGHVRKELAEEGYEGKALTIGTIDIGAGTTDVMVCAYECEGEGRSKLSPIPLFWDSFYLAGDDILRNIIQNIVIEGVDHGQPDMGNISSALTARIISMSDDELRKHPCIENVVYKTKISDICMTMDEDEKRRKKISFAANLIHDFFGVDSAMMGFKDRRCRTDFNTQISLPIAQKMMDLLRLRRPSRLYTYDDIFSNEKPADYLLSYFYQHFGFRFEELNWRYNPIEVADIVKATMEPLMKQLALVLYTQQCDIIVLAGRPTSIDAITELFIKYVPTAPDRLVRLNEYRVGSWFPTADGQGYFYDQKAMVAVGGMVGYLASHAGLSDLVIDFTKMIKKMKSTAIYIGEYNSRRQQVTKTLLSPTSSNTSMTISVFPAFIGCRQLDSNIYQARPLYAIYNNGNATTLQIRLSRNYYEDREQLILEEVMDGEYRNRKNEVELIPQSLADDGNYWLDKGEFELTIK